MSDLENRVRQLEHLVHGLKYAVPIVAAVVVASATFFGISLSNTKSAADEAKATATTASKHATIAVGKINSATGDATRVLEEEVLPGLKKELEADAMRQSSLFKPKLTVEQREHLKFGGKDQPPVPREKISKTVEFDVAESALLLASAYGEALFNQESEPSGRIQNPSLIVLIKVTGPDGEPLQCAGDRMQNKYQSDIRFRTSGACTLMLSPGHHKVVIELAYNRTAPAPIPVAQASLVYSLHGMAIDSQ